MSDVRIVKGNAFKLTIPLTLRTWSGKNYSDADFFPSADVTVVLTHAQGARSWKYQASIDGNTASVEDEGRLPLGTYHIEVLTADADGRPLRFKQHSVLQIVDTTAEAGIEPGVEFTTESWQLGAAVFLNGGSSIQEEIDPVFTASPAAGITQADISNWDSKTSNRGTVTGISVNGGATQSPDSSGVVGLTITVDSQLSPTSENPVQNKVVSQALAGKVGYGSDIVNQLTAAAVLASTAYQKPNTGIPKSDLSQEVQSALDNGGGGSIEQVQADWNQTNTLAVDYIKNKPTIPDVSGFATTDDVDAAVAALVSSAPQTLDTLKELADALGDDPNFATTMTTALAGKQSVINDLPIIRTNSGKGIADVSTQQDGTVVITLSNGDTYTIDLNHEHPQYVESDDLADVATSGSYDDLTDKPTIPAAYDDTALAGRVSALENAGYITTETDPTVPSWAKASTKPSYAASEISGLSTVATSGSYNDLSNKPTIPAAYDDTALAARVSALEGQVLSMTYNSSTTTLTIS